MRNENLNNSAFCAESETLSSLAERQISQLMPRKQDKNHLNEALHKEIFIFTITCSF